MATAQKVAAVEHLAEVLSQSRLVILSDYRGLSVAEIGRLRRQLREADATLEVAKNTLVRRAAQQVGIAEARFEAMLQGPTVLTFSRQPDIARTAKTLSDYARGSRTISIKGGLLGKRVLDAQDVERLAELPPREVLLARVVGGMQAPIAGLVTVLGGTVRGLMYVLQARKEQLAQQGG